MVVEKILRHPARKVAPWVMDYPRVGVLGLISPLEFCQHGKSRGNIIGEAQYLQWVKLSQSTSVLRGDLRPGA